MLLLGGANGCRIKTLLDFILYVHKQFSFISVLHTINGILSNGFHLPIRLDKRYGFRDQPSERQRNKVTRRKLYLDNRFVQNWKPTSFIYFICIKRTLYSYFVVILMSKFVVLRVKRNCLVFYHISFTNIIFSNIY